MPYGILAADRTQARPSGELRWERGSNGYVRDTVPVTSTLPPPGDW